MTATLPRPQADRTQLQQIIAGLTEGVLIINPDQTIAWVNEAALAMRGVKSLKELGGTVSEYQTGFELQYRNRHKLPAGDSPMDQVIAGEAFTEVVVEVTRPGEKRHRVQLGKPRRIRAVGQVAATQSRTPQLRFREADPSHRTVFTSSRQPAPGLL